LFSTSRLDLSALFGSMVVCTLAVALLLCVLATAPTAVLPVSVLTDFLRCSAMYARSSDVIPSSGSSGRDVTTAIVFSVLCRVKRLGALHDRLL